MSAPSIARPLIRLFGARAGTPDPQTTLVAGKTYRITDYAALAGHVLDEAGRTLLARLAEQASQAQKKQSGKPPPNATPIEQTFWRKLNRQSRAANTHLYGTGETYVTCLSSGGWRGPRLTLPYSLFDLSGHNTGKFLMDACTLPLPRTSKTLPPRALGLQYMMQEPAQAPRLRATLIETPRPFYG